MTTPSAFRGTGLSIVVSTPLVQGGTVIDNYYSIVTNYSHVISSNGGFNSANITISGNAEFLEDWLQNGLGRHMVVYGASGQTVWEGYVDQVDVTMGAATFTRGPLSNVGNRVSAMYTPLLCHCCDADADPDCIDDGEPITGTTTETEIVEDFLSQKKYGIWEKVLNLGEAWPDDAESVRNLYLYEYSNPEGNPSLSLSGNEGELSVKLTCKGYVNWLSYAYNFMCDDDSYEGQSIWASNKIIDVLEAEPNGLISTSRIKTNPVLTIDKDCQNRSAKTIIDDIVTLGGGSDDRWTFGVYANKEAIYEAIPTEVEYVYYKTGRTQQVERVRGGIVNPWEVVPCKWVAIPTFLAAFNWQDYNIRNDPRVFFAEEVNYTAPDQVTISGAKIRKLSQYMAKLGLGGM